jgi:hypothetical protein
LGSSIWSYTWRSGAAILCETRPETIIRSAWRGEERKTSAPKRATSYLGETIAIISIAQQASPNVSGQIEWPCAHATAFSTVVSMSLSSMSSTPSSRSKTLGPLRRISVRSELRP